VDLSGGLLMFKEIPGGSYEDIQGLRCWIPKPPPNYLIQGYDLPKKDQKWKRTPLPDDWDLWREEEAEGLLKDPTYLHSKIEAFKKQEWERRLFGHWLFINGKKVYLAPVHYFYLNWYRLDDGYAHYRDSDRRFFYFWQYCVEDPKCYGMIEGTMRRQGKTYRGACIVYETISRPPQKQHGGIQSKTASDASDLFADKLVEPWKDLPDFFKPESNCGSDPKSSITFFRDAKKGKGAKKVKQGEDFELRSSITWKPAKEKAYDGKALKILLHDEVGKTNPKEEADVYKRLKIVKPCLLKNGEIWGKVLLSSTVEDLEEGGAQFLDIWRESNQYRREKHGGTKSGLYRYFLSAIDGTYYDEFGFSDTKRAREYHDGEVAAIEDDPNAVVDYKRKFPYREEDMFIAPGDKCEFNAMILNERQNKLSDPDDKSTVRGDFVWKDGKKDTDAIWVPNSANGRWYVSWLPTKAEDCNKIARSWDYRNNPNHRPLNDEKFAMAFDPFSHGIVVGGHKSNAAAAVFRKFDPWVDNEKNVDAKGRPMWETNNWCADYLARPSDPEDSFEDMIIACVFFGCSLLPENNKIAVVDYFKKRGYSAFIMNRPQATFTKDGYSQDTPGIPSSRPMIEYYTNKLKTHVQNYGHLIKHLRIVKSLLEFNSLEPTKYDTTVACGYSLVAAEKQVYKQPAPINIVSVIPTYNNSGSTSELNYN
jgi:hypothetical protein